MRLILEQDKGFSNVLHDQVSKSSEMVTTSSTGEDFHFNSPFSYPATRSYGTQFLLDLWLHSLRLPCCQQATYIRHNLNS